MRNTLAFFAAALCVLLSSCHRPVAYFQPTSHPAATRLPVEKPLVSVAEATSDSDAVIHEPADAPSQPITEAIASLRSEQAQPRNTRIEQRMHRIQSLLPASAQTTDQQPDPKSKKKLKLGNRIRQSLGMSLRKELNWWQRISWKLKASVIVLIVAVVFAILHITILAIIFGIVGAFLMISGLKKSFKVRRPWF